LSADPPHATSWAAATANAARRTSAGDVGSGVGVRSSRSSLIAPTIIARSGEVHAFPSRRS